MKLLSLPQILNTLYYITTAKYTLKRTTGWGESAYHPKNIPYLKEQKQKHKIRQELNVGRKAYEQQQFLLAACNPADMLKQQVTMREN